MYDNLPNIMDYMKEEIERLTKEQRKKQHKIIRKYRKDTPLGEMSEKDFKKYKELMEEYDFKRDVIYKGIQAIAYSKDR